MGQRPRCERQRFLPTRNSTLKDGESSADFRITCDTATAVSRAQPGGPLKPRRPWDSKPRSNRCCGIAITEDGRVQAQEPDALADWIKDPSAAPHGGESVVAMIARVSAWLDTQLASPGVVLAITHASVIRAAIVCALEAEARSFWHIDIAPLSLTQLSGNGGRWTLVSMSSGKADQSRDGFG
jgi:broad specificity phosphatase PhoE